MGDVLSAKAHSSLGPRLESFRPAMSNVVAGAILGLLLVGGGLAILGFIGREVYLAGGNLPFYAKKGMCWLAVGLGSLCAVALIFGGGFLAWLVRWRLAHDVEMYENGFRYRASKNSEEITWDAVASIRETILYERPPVLKGPAKLLLPKVASKSYTVITISGKEYRFDGNSIKQIQRFGEMLREQAQIAGLTWETVEEHA